MVSIALLVDWSRFLKFADKGTRGRKRLWRGLCAVDSRKLEVSVSSAKIENERAKWGFLGTANLLVTWLPEVGQWREEKIKTGLGSSLRVIS